MKQFKLPKQGRGACNLCDMSDKCISNQKCVDDIIPSEHLDILVIYSTLPEDIGLDGSDLGFKSSRHFNDLSNIMRNKYFDRKIGYTSIVKCCGEKPSFGCINTCYKTYFRKLMQRMRPERLIFLGASAATLITGEKNITKGNRFDTMYGEAIVTSTWAEIAFNPEARESFKKDIEGLYSEIKYFDKDKFTINIAKNKQDIYDYFQILSKQKTLYVDIEGSTLPYSVSVHPHKVLSIAFTYRDNEAFVFPLDTLQPAMSADAIEYAFEATRILLANKKIEKIFQNGKYDVKYLRFVKNLKVINYPRDTIVQAYLEHEKQSRGLKELTNAHQPDMFEYDKILYDYIMAHDEANPKKGGSYLYIPNNILLPYNGLDTIALYREERRSTPIIEGNKRLSWLYHNILMPAWLEYIELEEYGWPVNRVGLEEESKRLMQVINHHTNKVMKYAFDRGIRDSFNLESPEDVASLFIKLGELDEATMRRNIKGVPTADEKDVIKCINNGSEVARDVNIARKAKSMLSKYCVSFLHDIDLEDKYHADYNLVVVDTGRTSEKRIQTITKKYRKFFTAGETDGMPRIFFEFDYSQLEIRLMACVAKVKLMLEIYAKNGDIHRLTGSSAKYIVHDEPAMMNLIESRNAQRIIDELMNYFGTFDKDTQGTLRQQAKPVNFSFLYRAYYLSVMNKINADLDKMIKELIMESYETEDTVVRAKLTKKIEELKKLYITEEQAKTFEKAYFMLYPEVRDYHDRCVDEVTRTGIITSPLGRMKHIPEAQLDSKIKDNLKRISHALNSSTNMPIQSLGGDCKFMALIRTMAAFRKNRIDAHILGDLHDALFASVAPDQALDAYHIMKESMCIHKGEFDWALIDIPVDGKIGLNWGKSEEIKSEADVIKFLEAHK